MDHCSLCYHTEGHGLERWPDKIIENNLNKNIQLTFLYPAAGNIDQT